VKCFKWEGKSLKSGSNLLSVKGGAYPMANITK
jgi:hypothetical protein